MSGELDISQDVLFGIAQLALDQVEGITATAPPAKVGEFLTGRRAKGIQINRDGDQLQVQLNVRVEYGRRIPELARQATSVVREAVASMTGLRVASVEVTVEAIDMPEELKRG